MPVMKLRIIAQPGEAETFHDQVGLIKASGAQFDGKTKTWWHTLTPEQITPQVLNPLFQAAMDYHTR